MLRFFTLIVAFIVLLHPHSAQADDIGDCRHTDDPELAIKACSRLIKANPKEKRAYNFRGLAYSRKDNFDKAIADFDKAIALGSDSPVVHVNRGRAYAGKGEHDRAIVNYSKAIELEPTARRYGFRAAAYSDKKEYGRAIADYSKAIELEATALQHSLRGRAYAANSEHGRAIADYTKAIELEPTALRYSLRASAYAANGEHGRGLADHNKAVELDPKGAGTLMGRARWYLQRGDLERALLDLGAVIENNPNSYAAFASRADILSYQGELDRALADANQAVKLDPLLAHAYAVRARILVEKKDFDSALGDAERAISMRDDGAMNFIVRSVVLAAKNQVQPAITAATKAIELDPKNGEAYALRADLLLKSGQESAATADLKQVLSLPARRPRERDAQVKAAEKLTSLSNLPDASKPGATTAPVSVPAAAPAVSVDSSGPRVALVIGNSRYVHAGELNNPANDARIIASRLRQIGFTDVVEKFDLGLPEMTVALKQFGDRAANAAWAVIYFAGHGLETGGIAYLVPTDAKLEKDTHVPDETVSLDRMLQKIESAKKLRLVILDACRNNPFLSRMVRTAGGTRSIGRGLPAIEVEGDVLVAYATKHGTTALDGSGDNSPYALALTQHLATPNTDVRVMFGKVRDTVRKETNNQQEPYTYGSIGGDLHFFVAAAR